MTDVAGCSGSSLVVAVYAPKYQGKQVDIFGQFGQLLVDSLRSNAILNPSIKKVGELAGGHREIVAWLI